MGAECPLRHTHTGVFLRPRPPGRVAPKVPPEWQDAENDDDAGAKEPEPADQDANHRVGARVLGNHGAQVGGKVEERARHGCEEADSSV